VEAPTPAEFDSALAVLNPEDKQKLVTFDADRFASFSLVRQCIEPESDVIGDMQGNLAEALFTHPGLPTWTSAGVKQPKYVGVTYLDGDKVAMARGDYHMAITGFALAVKMCAALPATAAQPVEAEVGKILSTPSNKPRIYITLGILCKAALAEYNAANAPVQRFLFKAHKQYDPPMRAPGHLAYVFEEKHGIERNSFLPAARMKETVEQAMPPGKKLLLDRVRLFLHPKGTSPYVKIKG